MRPCKRTGDVFLGIEGGPDVGEGLDVEGIRGTSGGARAPPSTFIVFE